MRHQYIARQKQIVEKLEREGADDVNVAVSMLRTLESTLRAFERHRELIIKLLQDGK